VQKIRETGCGAGQDEPPWKHMPPMLRQMLLKPGQHLFHSVPFED